MHKSISLKYEPSSEPRHISAKQWFVSHLFVDEVHGARQDTVLPRPILPHLRCILLPYA